MEPVGVSSRISNRRRKSSNFQRRRYPVCGSVDFINVRKGRCFLEPLLKQPKKTHTYQRINGLYSKGDAQDRGVRNYNFIHCVMGGLPPCTERSSLSSQTTGSFYTTDYLDQDDAF